MKVCYLILAHNNFGHLGRLIDALDDTDSSFYIHIDKKANQDYISSKPNVSVIPSRFDINWGGFAMVEATLSLLEYGLGHSAGADYYILLSGVDYPVRPKSFLYNLLAEGKEYIDIAPVPVPYKPVERYEYYYFDYDRRNLKHYNPLFLAEVLLKKLKLKRKAPFTVYAGSQWFALTHDCVRYILQIVQEDKRYVDFFRHTLVPDEAFFQTIVGNSPFGKKTTANLTYTDWEVPVPPATIEGRHIDFLKAHIEFDDEYGHRLPYFARKFNDDSTEEITRVQNELWR
ncbi:hypothetical protein D0T84_02875 [Dysgonomonas sp. 521]|uniref:beta-1,6-N-acetylglucosaminyltransferase n=1 Tax=Dysgonomonas sp. 521 TaxID=2302932 RepID=UPI0013D7504E|nr:beta-1,6-N-acetylglucosaminyltransferase [Dysgonomonas sp. 521]NDV93862.1 hypothetical protein [Dysgonomonas sp. 521]